MSFYFGSYNEGRIEGAEFLKLLQDIDPNLVLPPELPEDDPRLLEIFSWVSEEAGVERPLPYLNGFFSMILRDDGISPWLLNVFSVDELRDLQSQTAPICNVPPKSGFIQFIDWMDGDAWMIDLTRDCIRWIDVSGGREDLEEMRSYSGAVLPRLRHFISFLRCEADQYDSEQSRDTQALTAPESK